MDWLLLILSLPTGNATARQRAWRALKASGAAVLRDGAYVLPDLPPCRGKLEQVAAGVHAGGGTARLLRVQEEGPDSFHALFDRSTEYNALREEIDAAQRSSADAADAQRLARRLRKAFEGITQTDHFPGPAQLQAEQALRQFERQAARATAPDEPAGGEVAIAACRLADYRNRQWATRRRPWVDRLASAWLIRRRIDPAAHFLWLASPADCPPGAVGFDFDGATFTHAGERVTFEVLLAAFALEDDTLARMGRLVHHLDVGGPEPAEAAGIESLLAGLRDTHGSDDALLDAACTVFDALHASYQRETGR